MYNRIVFLMALLTAAIAGRAISQPAPALGPIPRAAFLSAMDNEYRKMDADKNGQVTRAEIESFQRVVAVAESGRRNRTLFAELDTDRNGQISPAEFTKITPTEPVNAMPLIAMYDRNKDGKVSQIEYRTIKLTRFDQIDSDKDGIVSLAEMKATGVVK